MKAYVVLKVPDHSDPELGPFTSVWMVTFTETRANSQASKANKHSYNRGFTYVVLPCANVDLSAVVGKVLLKAWQKLSRILRTNSSLSGAYQALQETKRDLK